MVEITAEEEAIVEMIGEVRDAVEELQDKVADIESAVQKKPTIILGIDGKDGKDGEDGRDGVDGKDGNIKDLSPEEVRNSLELLQGDERLDMSAIKGLLDEIQKIPKTLAQNVSGGRQQLLVGGAKKGAANHVNYVAGSNVSITHTLVNGVQTMTFSSGAGAGVTTVNEESVTFTGTAGTLAHTPTAGSLKLYRGGTRQKLNVDYTLSGANITLTSTADSAEVFVADYTY